MKKQMKSIQFLLIVFGITTTLTGCMLNNSGQRQQLGGLIGGAMGGLLGSKIGDGSGRVAATAAGAVAGFLIGDEIGLLLDKVDRAYVAQTANRALESNRSGQSSSWSNPNSGSSGTFTPTRTTHLFPRDGKDCREFRQTITVGGRSETARGTACRRADGTWRIIS